MYCIQISSQAYKRSLVEQVHRENAPITRVRPLLHPDLCCLGAADAFIDPGNLGPGTHGVYMHMDKIARVLTDPGHPTRLQLMRMDVSVSYSSASDIALFSWKVKRVY
jgi:hypothetical protein